MQEQNPIVLMNFSGIYREEEFWKNRQVSWIELQDVCGTNCYCDEEAIAEINKRTENYPTAGIHFIDSGNYHYMTRLWLTRMDQPHEPWKLQVHLLPVGDALPDNGSAHIHPSDPAFLHRIPHQNPASAY